MLFADHDKEKKMKRHAQILTRFAIKNREHQHFFVVVVKIKIRLTCKMPLNDTSLIAL